MTRITLPRCLAAISALLVFLCFFPVLSSARYVAPRSPTKDQQDPSKVLVLDGSNIHNVGALQMHVTNWGEFGSRPDTGLPYSWQPSAQWPAGTGIEYLFTAGLWVGALVAGVPAVSTAAFENEFRPSQDRRDIIYRTSEGEKGGNRRPHPKADDDRDGAIDEDWLDGRDNDLDGRIDEDFAAISRLMFSCQYSDDQAASRQIYSEHNPLGIVVRQTSFQWSGPRFDDFIGVQYQITNRGQRFLEELFVGLFVDGDAGPRGYSNYWEDDLTARRFVPVACTDFGPVQFDFAYTYDADGDDGLTPGLFGVVMLDHPIDTEGGTAPSFVSFSSYNSFAGHQSFEEGGDPTNDFERYELLSRRGFERPADLPRDYRMLVGAGPFIELAPESTLVVQVAFAIGAGEDAFANAASAAAAFDGAWFDLDGNPLTGIDGREKPFYGPYGQVWQDSCRIFKPPIQLGCDGARLDAAFNKPIPRVKEGEVIWSNADCETECLYSGACGYGTSDSLVFRTGVDGREGHIHWIMDAAPPPPKMRIDDRARGGVVIYWDSFSESEVDNITQQFDFEGYQVYRADDWTRPLGTSVVTGPPSDLWHALFQADIINSFGEDVGLGQLRYEPLTHVLTPIQIESFLNTIQEFLLENPDEDPPCPGGVTQEVCDTLIALALERAKLPGGRHYYRYVDSSVHLGRPYFYSVVAFDHVGSGRYLSAGISGVPSSNFVFVEPKSSSLQPYEYRGGSIYVVPNPATRQSMADWSLDPTNEDPSGTKIEFRNVPFALGTIRIYTLAGDLVKELRFDGRTGNGTVAWNLVSRNGQDITSGVYLYSVEMDSGEYPRTIDKFTVIR